MRSIKTHSEILSVLKTRKTTENTYKTSVIYTQDATDIWQSEYTSRRNTWKLTLCTFWVWCAVKTGKTKHSTLIGTYSFTQQFSYKQEGICFTCSTAFTCSTIGSCSGGLRFSLPYDNQTWNAVSCSAKNGLCSNAELSSITLGS